MIPNPEGFFERPDGKYWTQVYETALARLSVLRADRDSLEAQLEHLNSEIVRFEKVISTLRPIASDGLQICPVVPTFSGIADLGLADACREILKHDPRHRTARGVRDSLIASDYDIEQHSNPLASVHSVLKRLAEQGDVEEFESEGKTRYRWKDRGVTGSVRVHTNATSFAERFMQGQAKLSPRQKRKAREQEEELAALDSLIEAGKKD